MVKKVITQIFKEGINSEQIVKKLITQTFKMQMKCFFLIAEFERATKVRKIAVYRFLISLLVPEI